MKRFAVCGVGLALALAAGPAYASNSGDQGNGGPPTYSGNWGASGHGGATVIHCNSAVIAAHGVVVINSNGIANLTCGP